MPARHTLQDMQLWASDKGGKCLSKEYWGAEIKFTWRCSKGHTWDAVPSSIRQGSWCPACSGMRKGTIEEMRRLAIERGGKCLSKTYSNKETKLKWKCAEGHVWQAIPGSIIHQKSWCPVCSIKKMGNKGKIHTIEEMYQIAKERKGKCLSKKYTDVDALLKWKCARGHVWHARPYTVLHRGSWCSKCRYIDRSTKHKYHQNFGTTRKRSSDLR